MEEDGRLDLKSVGRYIGSSINDGDNKAIALSLKRLKEALEVEHTDRIEVGCWCSSIVSHH